MAYGKKNVIKIDPLQYNLGIIGEGGIGKTTLIKEVCEKLACLGVKIDLDKNNITREKVKLSTDDSKIEVWVIPTDEELMIARDTLNLIKNR